MQCWKAGGRNYLTGKNLLHYFKVGLIRDVAAKVELNSFKPTPYAVSEALNRVAREEKCCRSFLTSWFGTSCNLLDRRMFFSGFVGVLQNIFRFFIAIFIAMRVNLGGGRVVHGNEGEAR